MNDNGNSGRRSEGGSARVVKSEELLSGGVEVLIDHDSIIYRLRKTSTGKLILTK